MRRWLPVLIVLISTGAFADSPFPGTDGKTLFSGYDDCSATEILNKAIAEAGVNPLNPKEPPRAVWTCECKGGRGSCDGGTDETRYLLNECQDGQAIKCYSNTSSQFPALCLEEPRVIKVKKEKGGTSTNDEARARFKSVFVVRLGGDGYSKNKTWHMDAKGCEPVSAYDGNPAPSLSECERKIRAYLTGGTIFSPDVSQKKYCDGEVSQDHLNAISDLHACIEAYPKLKDSSQFAKNTSTREDVRPKNKGRVQRRR